MTMPASRYDYEFDPAGEGTAARVCRLAGEGKRVLELGCAAGAMSAVLKQHYRCTVTGVEYDPKAARAAAEHCESLVVASLDEPDWAVQVPHGSFDTVIAADVLEHLRDPEGCLRQIRGLLAADGKVVISVPNLAHSGVLAALLCDDFQYAEIGLLDRTHIHFFTATTLKRMLQRCGYEVVHADTVNADAGHPEFERYWRALPPQLHTWLEGNPAGHAFQVIMVARPAGRHEDARPTATSTYTAPPAQREWLSAFPAQPAAQPTPGHENALVELENRYAALEAELQAVKRSRSWRVTAPLRRISRWLGKA